MSLALLGGIAAAAQAVAQAIAGKLASTGQASGAAAFKHGKGVNGPDCVRTWPGGWKAGTHAKHVFEAVKAGKLMPFRWEAVRVDPRLVVWVMHDAIAIGDSPPARIPLNASNYQRLADRLGAQLGIALHFPTPKIVDAVHLAAVASGRVLAPVTRDNKGQVVSEWLDQQDKIAAAVKTAGGYPASGVLSTVGKDCTLSPELANRVGDHDVPGEPGPKLEIYGWPTYDPKKQMGHKEPHTLALAAAGYQVIQPRSNIHADLDNGESGSGGFWDYSQTERYVAGICLLDGATARLSDVYEKYPALVYDFRGAPVRKIPTRYPRVPDPSSSVKV
jgi:hypothetical protein